MTHRIKLYSHSQATATAHALKTAGFSEAMEDTIEAIAENYSIDLTDCEDEEEQGETVREYLEENGAFVGEVSGGFVYRAF